MARIEGVTLHLEAQGAEVVDVAEGDAWQGVYRFDNYAIRGSIPVDSADPIRVAGTQEIVGNVQTREIVAENLILRTGAVLTHPATSSATSPESLRIELSGDLVIEPGASIDVSVKGFPRSVTYPGATLPGHESGGSHMGYGGNRSGRASTYGSVYRPQEPGGGGQDGDRRGGVGGGVVRISAANVTLTDSTSVIRANGGLGRTCCSRGAAGGSVWISTGGFYGDGVIEARGAASRDGMGSGGGGAIAVEYTETTGTVTTNLRAHGGSNSVRGGAGTAYLFGPGAVYGDLLVDNSTVAGESTRLPALGGGLALAASGGAVLATDRTVDVPAYFVGHWVEIYDGVTGLLEGTYRIASVAGTTVTLAAAGGETIAVDPDDRWQGVYRFDNVAIRGTVPFFSSDPVLVTGTQQITGDVTLRRVLAGHLTVTENSVLRQPATTSNASPEILDIVLTGDMTVGTGASIDVSTRGFARSVTYPGASAPGHESGGSHLGYGGNRSSLASTFGSVYRPQEPGGGGQDGDRRGGVGGGVVRIVATNVTLADATSGIRSNGGIGRSCCSRGAAGGSVWIRTEGFFGEGFIEARGANSTDGMGLGRRRRDRGGILRDFRLGAGQPAGLMAATPAPGVARAPSTYRAPGPPTAT